MQTYDMLRLLLSQHRYTEAAEVIELSYDILADFVLKECSLDTYQCLQEAYLAVMSQVDAKVFLERLKEVL